MGNGDVDYLLVIVAPTRITEQYEKEERTQE